MYVIYNSNRVNAGVDIHGCLMTIVVALQVFGAMLSCGPKVSDHFYGSGETYLFTFYPRFQVQHFCFAPVTCMYIVSVASLFPLNFKLIYRRYSSGLARTRSTSRAIKRAWPSARQSECLPNFSRSSAIGASECVPNFSRSSSIGASE